MLHNLTYIARVAEPNAGVQAPDLAALALPAGRWEPLIERRTWRRRTQQIARHQQMPKPGDGTYLLSGLLGARVAGCACRAVSI